MFNFKLWLLRRRMRRRVPKLKVIKHRTLNKAKSSWTKWLIDIGLIGAWTTAIIYNPSSIIVSALSVTLLSSAIRRCFHMAPGMASDLMHPVLDIGAFALATSAWLWAREFVILATTLGIPAVTSDIRDRYHSYA